MQKYRCHPLEKAPLLPTLMLFTSLCLDNGKQIRTQKYLGFLRHFFEQNTYMVPTPHPQLHSVLQLYLLQLLSLKDTAAGLTGRLCVVREQKAELFIHLSVLIKMHRDCSKLSLRYQLWQNCSSESKI